MATWVLAATLGVALLVLLHIQAADRRWRLDRVAEALGLQRSTALDRGVFAALGGDRLSGSIAGVDLVIETTTRRSGVVLRIETWILPCGFTLRPQTGARALRETLGEADVAIGDPAFDTRVVVEGDVAAAVAALDDQARRAMLRTSRSGGALTLGADGALVCEAPLLRDVDGLVELVRWFAASARALCGDGTSLDERLYRNAVHGTQVGARLRSVSLVLDRGGEWAERAARTLLGASEPDLRFAAALYLRDPTVLTEIAGTATASPQVRASAVLELARLAPEDAFAPLRTFVRESRILATSTAEWLHRGWEVEVIHAMRRVVEAAGPGVEQQLIELLADASGPLEVAIVEELGGIGTKAALPSLDELQSHGDRAAASAARSAIDRIVARAGPGIAGALTAVPDEHEQGAVSLARDSGALAMVTGAVERRDHRNPTKQVWRRR